jgi:hypothetical protein
MNAADNGRLFTTVQGRGVPRGGDSVGVLSCGTSGTDPTLDDSPGCPVSRIDFRGDTQAPLTIMSLGDTEYSADGPAPPVSLGLMSISEFDRYPDPASTGRDPPMDQRQLSSVASLSLLDTAHEAGHSPPLAAKSPRPPPLTAAITEPARSFCCVIS